MAIGANVRKGYILITIVQGGSMKNKTFGFTAAVALLATLVMLPASVLAFWPFDSGNGQVQGAQAPIGGGFMGLIQRFFHIGGATGTNTMYMVSGPSGATGAGFPYMWGPSGATGAFGMGMMGDPKARLDAAVAAGKITQAEETEILNQLAAIRSKQQELMSLQTAFYQYLKTNNISTTVLGGEPPHAMPLNRGYVSGPTGYMPTGNYRPYEQGNNVGGRPPGYGAQGGGYTNPSGQQ